MNRFDELITGDRLSIHVSRRTLLRTSFALGASFSAMSLLAACGGDDDNDDEPEATTPAGNATTPAGNATATSGGGAQTTPSVSANASATASSDEPTPTTAAASDIEQGGELIYALSTASTHWTRRSRPSPIRDAWPATCSIRWSGSQNRANSSPAWRQAGRSNETADEYTFTLRDDVTFHDGSALTADALKFTYDRIVDPETKSQVAFSALGPYAGTEVVDPQTAVIRFKKPYAPFLNSVSSVLLAPLPPAVVEELGFDFGIQPVGTGPFIFDSYQTDTQVRMVKNPDYTWGPSMFAHQGPAYLDAITWRIIPEGATRLAALQSGEIHIMQNVPTQDYATVEDNDDLAIIDAVLPGSGWSMMNNVTRAPNDDLNVRKALQYGVDKEGLIQAVWQGLYEVSHSPLTSVTFAYDPATEPRSTATTRRWPGSCWTRPAG